MATSEDHNLGSAAALARIRCLSRVQQTPDSRGCPSRTAPNRWPIAGKLVRDTASQRKVGGVVIAGLARRALGGCTSVTTYKFSAVRWARGWELHHHGQCVTQVEDLAGAVRQARDYLATVFGGEADEYDVLVTGRSEPVNEIP